MTDRGSVNLFGVESVADYLRLCEEAVAEFAEDQGNVLRGFTAILTLNHLPDWLEHKLLPDEKSRVGISTGNTRSLRNGIEVDNPELTLVRELANGFKHLRPIDPTEQISGYGQGPFGVGPWGTPYLLIDLGEECDSRWVIGLELCQQVLNWWVSKLDQVLPSSNGEGLVTND